MNSDDNIRELGALIVIGKRIGISTTAHYESVEHIHDEVLATLVGVSFDNGPMLNVTDAISVLTELIDIHFKTRGVLAICQPLDN